MRAWRSRRRSAGHKVVSVDRVIAVVNDEAITQYELDDAKRIVLQQLKQQKVQPPARDVLDKQVLERMMTERRCCSSPRRTESRSTTRRSSARSCASRRKTSCPPRSSARRWQKENIDYPKYREDIRNELTVQRLREREVDSKITVSDAEVDQYLASIKSQAGGDSEYNLAHILVIVPEQASADQIDAQAAARRGRVARAE